MTCPATSAPARLVDAGAFGAWLAQARAALAAKAQELKEWMQVLSRGRQANGTAVVAGRDFE